jgi:UDP-N-acetylmuramate dehydrogenase
MATIQEQVPLAPYTSLSCGGPAEKFVECYSREELISVIGDEPVSPPWILGYGANVLISDKGLPGVTIVWRGGDVIQHGTHITVDGGVWWDDVVQRSILTGLWGMELTSGIPGSVAAAIVGNIAAYGQQANDRLVEIDVFNTITHTVKKISREHIDFGYRMSSLQDSPYIILGATFSLSPTTTTQLSYASATAVAEELKCNTNTLEGRRTTIMETRKRAGSLYDPSDPSPSRTAGSFFKNPLVHNDMAEFFAKFDESGKAMGVLKLQNAIHGGDVSRASVAHILLAAGFKRGQTWGPVRLHPQHVMKIENIGGAKAQDIYNVAQGIIETVRDKFELTIEPEVKFLGEF